MSVTPRSRYFTLAHRYVSVALYNGDLPRLDGSIPCVDCGAPAQEYDHRDYKKPMEVEPVCKECNFARGPGLHRDPSETAIKPLTIRQRFNRGLRGGPSAHTPPHHNPPANTPGDHPIHAHTNEDNHVRRGGTD